MTNKQKYNKAFIETLDIDGSLLGDSLEYNSVSMWDSLGHMTLIAALEEAFDVSMEMDDIIDFDSYNKGLELLAKYEIAF